MQNWYQAIIDLEAGPDEAAFLALKVVTRLTAAGIIEPGNDQGLNGSGAGLYKPGKNFAQAVCGAGGTSSHDLDNLGSMEAEAGPWVNMFGLASLEVVSCPTCGTKFGTENGADVVGVIEGFAEASRSFYSGTRHPKVPCPVCHGEIPATDWNTQPHLGYCYLAFIFWNWPPFSEWDVDVPRVVQEALKHKTILTYGSHH